MRVDVAEPDEGLVVLHPVGDVDLDTAHHLRAALERVDGLAAGRVVVDLADVGFMDSVGLGQLVWMAVRGKEAERRLVAANVRPILRNAITVMGLTQLIELHPFGQPPPWPGVSDTTTRAPWD